MKAIRPEQKDRHGLGEVISYLARFRADDLIEFRALSADDTRRFWVTPVQYPELHPELLRLDRAGYNIYVAVNPRSRHGSSESAVQSVVAFHVDVDAGRFAAIDPQKGGEQGPMPFPSLVVNSGHGHHLYWILAEPVPVTDENRAHLKAINRGLARAVGGDGACCDLARVLRPPGFTNHKPPIAPVRMVAQRPDRYLLQDLEQWAIDGPQPPQSNATLQAAPMSWVLKHRFDRFRLADTSGEVTRAWRGEVGDGSSNSRYLLAKRLKASGRFTPDEVVSIVCSRRWFNRISRRHRLEEDVRRDAIRLVRKLS